jgi:beta-lactamase class D
MVLAVVIGVSAVAQDAPVAPAKKKTPSKSVRKSVKKVPAKPATAAKAAPAKAAPVRAAAKTTAVAKPQTGSIQAGKATSQSSAKSLVAVTGRTTGRTSVRRRGWVQTWDEPVFKDSTSADDTAGEDLVVRRAAVEALGPLNGSVVVVDPSTGRVLTMVNQQLALGGGFIPCSTVKVSVALAGLKESMVPRINPVRFFSKRSQDLTDALAFSNNAYFANLGVKLGYDRFSHYARMFGYGEKAGLNIEGEHAGYFPPAPPKNGGMGMLTSFGEEISQTPLELAGLMTAIANRGTLYWLQYPRTEEEIRDFQPQIKRRLDIGPLVDDLKPGMRGAVEFGTARRAKQEQEIYGKTGTCSEGRTRLGWFGSFNEGGRKVVVVVMLTGGRQTVGPLASGVAGEVYRILDSERYFRTPTTLTPATLLPSQIYR